MGKSWISRLLASSMVVLIASTGVAWAAPITFTSTALATGISIPEENPEISGAYVAWDWTPGPSGSDIVVQNLATGDRFTIGANDGHDQTDPDVSLGRIAYQSDQSGNWDIYVYDTRFSGSNKYTTSSDDEVKPRIDGNLLVWHNETQDTLWYRDMRRGINAQVPGTAGIDCFDVDNGRIVWAEAGVVKKFTPAEPFGAANVVWNGGPSFLSTQAHGDLVAVGRPENGEDAIAINLLTLVRTNLMPSSAFAESEPAVFHNGAVWHTTQSGNGDLAYRVFGDVLSTVAASGDDESDASIYGRRVVYERRPGMSTADIWMAAAKPEVTRTAGANRYATAGAVSRAYFSAAAFDQAVLCTGADFPDALSAAPLARVLGGPLLLTKQDSVPAETMAELDRLSVKKVIIIGGPSAVSEAVKAQLESAGYSTFRVAGANRYETSVKVAEFMYAIPEPAYKPTLAFFARGDAFPDALAVGPVAAGALAPVILVQPNALPAVAAQAVDAMNLTSGFVVGGTSAVSAGVLGQLNALVQANGGEPLAVGRWAGTNRYETAIAVIEGAMTYYRWIDLDTLGVATGTNFPDALGGGAALGYYGSAVLLTSGTSVPASVTAFLDRHQYEIGRVDVFGGTSAVSDAVKNAIGAKVK